MNLWKLIITSHNGVQLLKWGTRFRVQWADGQEVADYEDMHSASFDFERRCLS